MATMAVMDVKKQSFFFFYRPRTYILEQMRKDWAARPKEFLKLIQETERITGVQIEAELYKRPPKPAPIPELERFFAWRGQIGCVIQEAFSEATFGPRLGERVRDFFVKLMPLYDYFNRFCV